MQDPNRRRGPTIPTWAILLGVLLGGGVLLQVGRAVMDPQAFTPAPQGPPPELPFSVLRPTFSTTQGEVSAGSAFVVRVDGHKQPVLLSALHLLGPAGGLSRDVPATEVGSFVEGVDLVDAFTDSQIGSTEGAIVIPSASESHKRRGAGDILAFWMGEDSTATVHKLAKRDPRVGDPVWLVAELASGPKGQLHRGVVDEITDGQMYYQFDAKGVGLRATSGAPVVNGNGAIVGINLGGGEEGGVVFGWSNCVSNFREPLLEAMRSSK